MRRAFSDGPSVVALVLDPEAVKTVTGRRMLAIANEVFPGGLADGLLSSAYEILWNASRPTARATKKRVAMM